MPSNVIDFQFFNIEALNHDPRKESVFDMFKFACCPQLNWGMFTTYITIIDIVIFIAILFIGGIKPDSQFLTPSWNTLRTFGDRDPCLMKDNVQVWRFVTPVFLNANFLSLFFDVVSTLIIGCMIESLIGTKKTIIIYFVSDIGGELFGALVSNNPAVGACTGIGGLLGAYIAYVIVNWEVMDYPGSPREMMLCFAFIIILFLVMFTLGSMISIQQSMVDVWGVYGGLIVGVFIGMAIITANAGRYTEYEKGVKKWGYILMASYFVIGFACFYLFRNPFCYTY